MIQKDGLDKMEKKCAKYESRKKKKVTQITSKKCLQRHLFGI